MIEDKAFKAYIAYSLSDVAYIEEIYGDKNANYVKLSDAQEALREKDWEILKLSKLDTPIDIEKFNLEKEIDKLKEKLKEIEYQLNISCYDKLVLPRVENVWKVIHDENTGK